MEQLVVKKIAIVYDWIDKWGGVERILLTLHEMFPEADFYTSYYDSEKASWAKELKIKTSFIQKLPKFIKRSRLISLPFYPYAFESLDFSKYDLVISVTSSFAKSIITKPDTRHICYLLTPTRFLWSHENEYFKNKILKSVISPYVKKIKEWDFVAAQRPDKIISISETVSNRCRKYYKRESEVIYPPFDTQYWDKIKKQVILGKSNIFQTDSGQNGNSTVFRQAGIAIQKVMGKKYLLIVSRLEPYKKVDLIIQSFNRLNDWNLLVVGEGSMEGTFRRKASKNVTFLSRLSDQELGYLYSNAEALIMAQDEDFGYVSLEAQFFGCPVIAYKRGGAVETVIEGKSGLFFNEQSEKSFKEAVSRFDMVKYDLKRYIRSVGQKNVEKFSRNKFEAKFINLI